MNNGFVRPIEIERARLLGGSFKNFSGRGDRYNREGDRYFHVAIDPAMVEELLAEGWNVKMLPPREEGDDETYFLKVKVSYRKREPKIYTGTTPDRMIPIHEDTVGDLDRTEMLNIDLIIQPSPYTDEDTGERRMSAYLDQMYITTPGSRFSERYTVCE